MIDSTTALTFVAILGGAIVTGVGSAMGWFRLQRKAIDKTAQTNRTAADEEFKKVWLDMKDYREKQADHTADIRVLQEKMSNNVERLDQIWETTKDTNAKLEGLSTTFTNVLIELKSQGRG